MANARLWLIPIRRAGSATVLWRGSGTNEGRASGLQWGRLQSADLQLPELWSEPFSAADDPFSPRVLGWHVSQWLCASGCPCSGS